MWNKPRLPFNMLGIGKPGENFYVLGAQLLYFRNIIDPVLVVYIQKMHKMQEGKNIYDIFRQSSEDFVWSSKFLTLIIHLSFEMY